MKDDSSLPNGFSQVPTLETILRWTHDTEEGSSGAKEIRRTTSEDVMGEWNLRTKTPHWLKELMANLKLETHVFRSV